MNLLLKGALLLWGLCCILSCQPPAPNPFADGKPRIKSISFSGIPQENIAIDQNAQLITVQTPARLSGMPSVTLELTDSAVWVNSKIEVAPQVLLGAVPGFQFIIQSKSNKAIQTIYTITSKATGRLQIDQPTAPLSYSIQNGSATYSYGITIPVLNLYGNPLPREAHLTNDNTQEVIIVQRGAPESGVNGVNYNLLNLIGIELVTEKLLPGSYHISFIEEDGTVLKINQPLLVRKGQLTIDYEAYIYFGYQVTAGKSFSITGSNLFPDEFSLELVDKQSHRTALSNLVFDPYGQKLTVSIPIDQPSGQYVLRVLTNSGRLLCLRVNVAGDELTRPLLGTLVTSDVSEATPCSINEPVPAPKETALFFTSSQTKQQLDKAGQHVLLKLIPSQGRDLYYATVLPYDGTNTGFPGSFTIPGNVPAGLYTAILQVLDTQNSVINESLPYGRTLSIQ